MIYRTAFKPTAIAWRRLCTATAIALAATLTACATPPSPVGLWKNQTKETLVKFYFWPDGRCVWMVAHQPADGRPGDGMGSYCRYEITEQGAAITRFTNEDGSDTRDQPPTPSPLQFRWAPGGQQLIYDIRPPITLQRSNAPTP